MKPPGKIIEDSKPVYPIIAVLMIVAVEKPAESSIHRLVKGSAGPFSRTPALPHGDKVVRVHPRHAQLHPVRPTLLFERAGVILSDLILRWYEKSRPAIRTYSTVNCVDRDPIGFLSS